MKIQKSSRRTDHPTPSLNLASIRTILRKLTEANTRFSKAYPGDSAERQPVHTVYGGAHLFQADSARELGSLALKALEEYAPDPASFAGALGFRNPGGYAPERSAEPETRWTEEIARIIYGRVLEKLKREPVEDFRIDFEDGYGNRPDAEEDHHAAKAAEEVALGISTRSLPPFIGIRIKPLSGEFYARSLRTLDIFISTLAKKASGRLPPRFFVTIPKITVPEQVSAVANILDRLESKLKLARHSMKIELMVETPQSILDPEGASPLKKLVEAAQGRCTGAHFGTYDYTASCNITATHQHMAHPACDFAKHVMQVSLAGTGVALSDGATNIMPAPPHRAADRSSLTSQQTQENRLSVHRAWRLHYEHIQHSLSHGYYQGWDLHPAQLPTRYAAIYSFFLKDLAPTSLRLKNFIDKAAQATLVGDVFDDAATGQGLLNFFLRGLNCGAFTETDARATGLAPEEIRGRSFIKILQKRRAQAGKLALT